MEYVYLALGVLLLVSLTVKLCRNYFAPVTAAKATVIHKQTVETFSKYSGTGKHTKDTHDCSDFISFGIPVVPSLIEAEPFPYFSPFNQS